MLKRLFMFIPPASLIPVLLALLPAAAVAADEAANRFQIEKTKYGFVRLDGQTGAMIFCREEDDILTCSPANSETSAVEDQLRVLEEKVNKLETDLKAALDEASKAPFASGKLPSDAEIDAAFSYFEKLMRKFMDMTRELDQDGGLPQRS